MDCHLLEAFFSDLVMYAVKLFMKKSSLES